MKRSIALFALAALTTGCLWVLNKAQPAAEPVARDPERVARGRYLADHVSNCFSCHPGDGTATESTRFGPEYGILGEVWAANLSPDTATGLGNWTDGQVLRAIREGVDNDHEALVPLMPYLDYREMSDEDGKSLVAYLRSLPPIKVSTPPRRLELVYSLFLNLVPKPVEGRISAPSPEDKMAYGKYLATLASCASCHTPLGVEGFKTELAYTGGRRFPLAGGGEVVSGDITADPTTGIGKWTDQELRDAITKGILPGGKQIRGPMPWRGYAGMSDGDLGALIAYLRTVPPKADKPGG